MSLFVVLVMQKYHLVLIKTGIAASKLTSSAEQAKDSQPLPALLLRLLLAASGSSFW